MPELTEQDMLKMKLHEIKVVRTNFIWIVRVPSGWIYYMQQAIKRDPVYPSTIPSITQVSITATFVPEPRPLAIDYAGYDEWLAAEQKQYPECQKETDNNICTACGKKMEQDVIVTESNGKNSGLKVHYSCLERFNKN